MKKDLKFRYLQIFQDQVKPTQNFIEKQISSKQFKKDTLSQKNVNIKFEPQFSVKSITQQQSKYHEQNFNQTLHKQFGFFNQFSQFQTSSKKSQSKENQKTFNIEVEQKQQLPAYYELFFKKINKILNKKVKNIFKQSWKKIKIHQQQQTQLAMLFTNHCATLIQKHFRRYIQQKYYKKIMPIVNRMKQLINAISQGWKVRKIFKTRTISRLINQIRSKEIQKKYRDMRIQKRQLVKEVTRLMKGNKWIQQFKVKRIQKKKTQKINFQKIINKNSQNKIKSNQVRTSINQMKISQKKNQFRQQPTIQYDDRPLKPAAKNINQLQMLSYDQKQLRPAQQNIFTADLKEQSLQKTVKLKKVIKIDNKKKKTSRQKKIIAKDIKQLQNTEIKVQQKKIQQPSKILQQKVIQQDLTQQIDLKKQYLKKRIKYDPRKAIQQQKLKKQQNKKNQLSIQKSVKSISILQPKAKSKTIEKYPQKVKSKKQIKITQKKGAQNVIKLNLNTQQIQKPKIKTLRSPNNEINSTIQTKQRHIMINELQNTYTGAYNNKKLQMRKIIQKLNRQSKNQSYPITTIKKSSRIYNAFKIQIFYKMDSILEKRFIQMLNM